MAICGADVTKQLLLQSLIICLTYDFYNFKNICRMEIDMNKKIFLMPALIIMLFSIPACGKSKEVQEQADVIVQAVNTDNIADLKNIILNGYTSDIIMDNELSDFFNDSKNEEDGLITKIIKKDNIKVKEVKKDIIIYEISAPQLDNMIEDILADENITVNEFNNAIYEYIDNAPLHSREVNVNYSNTDNNFSADYNTYDFVNALTGGLVEGYNNLLKSLNN